MCGSHVINGALARVQVGAGPQSSWTSASISLTHKSRIRKGVPGHRQGSHWIPHPWSKNRCNRRVLWRSTPLPPLPQGRWETTHTIACQRNGRGQRRSRELKRASWRPSSHPRNAPAGPRQAQVGPGERLCATTSLAGHGLDAPVWHLLEQLDTHGLQCVPCDSGMCRVTLMCAA